MRNTVPFQKEKNAILYMTILSCIGWLLFLYYLFHLSFPQEIYILILLTIFLSLSQYYPIPVWRGYSSLCFPITYTLYFIYGLPITLVIFGLIVLFVNAIRRHPLRIIIFNPAQLSLSFFVAVKCTEWIIPYFFLNIDSNILFGIIHFTSATLIYYVVNNLIVDIVLILRPQKYTIQIWKQKILTESITAIITLIYGVLFFILGSQNRGEIDFVAFFFFFSPLIGFTLLSSVIARLKKEKNRLNALFAITEELNNLLPTKDWLHKLKDSFQTYINVDANILWIKQNNEWIRGFEEGSIRPGIKLSEEDITHLEKIKSPVYIEQKKSAVGVASRCFQSEINSFVYVPLVVEGETLGMFLVGRSRTKSFVKDDINSINSLANQLAITMKTRHLLQEQKRFLILEERNRIARDIHDGVAQTLAGAIMKLETAERKFNNKKQESLKLLQESVPMMRHILKEVRESIYALRPSPTSKIPLSSAIMQKINNIQDEYDLAIHFDIRGVEKELSTLVEKVMYETFQEGLHNSIKHSKATKIDVLLSYQSEHILLKMKDNGVGFSLYDAMVKARSNPHFGILNMNEAADKIQASFQIDSKEGVGTEITLKVPKMGFEGEDWYDQGHVSG